MFNRAKYQMEKGIMVHKEKEIHVSPEQYVKEMGAKIHVDEGLGYSMKDWRKEQRRYPVLSVVIEKLEGEIEEKSWEKGGMEKVKVEKGVWKIIRHCGKWGRD